MEQKILAYFKECVDPDPRLITAKRYDKKKKKIIEEQIWHVPPTRPISISGLAVALGVNRDTLLEYSYDDEFSGTLKKARAIVEQAYEERMLRGGQGMVTGAIFALKANFGWNDGSKKDDSQNLTLIGIIQQIAADNRRSAIDITPHS